MAAIFDKNGIESIKDREVYFGGTGFPVKEDGWRYFKNLKSEMERNPNRRIVISESMIYDTFNPVIEVYSGRTIQSPTDRFKLFCQEQGLRIINDFGMERDYTIVLDLY